MADRASAEAALLGAIEGEIANLPKIGNTVSRARAIADLSRAFRYVSGGAQPSTVEVDVKA